MNTSKNYCLALAYDGSAYQGWQDHPERDVATIQAAVNLGVSLFLGGDKTKVYAAGRTDKGVHATAQVIHFNTNVVRKLNSFIPGINHYLPTDIRIITANQVDEKFHARFKACKRTYHYIITSSTYPGWRHYAYVLSDLPDIELMNQACELILGEHDFSTWRSAGCGSSNAIRYIYQAKWSIKGDFIVFSITANGYLYNMVRNLIGLLLKIGYGKFPPTYMITCLQGGARSYSPYRAPSQGLYLSGIEYPSEYKYLSILKIPSMIS